MSGPPPHGVPQDAADAAQQLHSPASYPQHGLHAGLQLAHEILLRRIARAPLPALQLLALLRRVRILFCLLRRGPDCHVAVRGAVAVGRTTRVLPLRHHIALCRIFHHSPAAASPAPRRRPLPVQSRETPLPRCFGWVDHTQRRVEKQDFPLVQSLDGANLSSDDGLV